MADEEELHRLLLRYRTKSRRIVAGLIGVDMVTLKRWEEYQVPSTKYFRRIARAYGIPRKKLSAAWRRSAKIAENLARGRRVPKYAKIRREYAGFGPGK